MTHTLRMTLIAATTALLALAGLSGSTPSADEKPIHLDDAWARQAPMGGQAGGGHGGSGAKGNGAVYVRISNHGKQADALISAASDAADTVELHEVRRDVADHPRGAVQQGRRHCCRFVPVRRMIRGDLTAAARYHPEGSWDG